MQLNSPTPFPLQRPSNAMLQEDAFMQAHSGSGPRSLLWLANLLTPLLRLRHRGDQTDPWPIKLPPHQTQATRPQASALR